MPGWDEMVTSVRRAAERANANRPQCPETLIFAPEGMPVRGLLIGLHMYGGTAAESAPFWRSASEVGLVIVVPESTQVSGDGEPAWPDPGVTARDVRLARGEALGRYPRSGCGNGDRWSLTGRWPSDRDRYDRRPIFLPGLVAVVSAYPDVEDGPAAARDAAAHGLRAYLVTGDRDTMRDQVEHLYDDLVAGGVQVKLDLVAGLGTRPVSLWLLCAHGWRSRHSAGATG
jgi:hypothetical protein